MFDRQNISRLSSLEEHTSASCISNCSKMFCGSGHFKKQERIMNKFVAKKMRQKTRESDVQTDMRQSLLNQLGDEEAATGADVNIN